MGNFEDSKVKSYIREWVRLKKDATERDSNITFGIFFSGMIYCLTIFAEKEHKLGDSNLSAYSGDASLFELGCYLYFRLDSWLYQNKPLLRKEISQHFLAAFIKLFDRALKIDNVAQFAEERIKKYGALFRERKGVASYHFYVSELIHQTKYNALPAVYDLSDMKMKMENMSFFDSALIKAELISWEKTMFPAAIEILRKYCAFLIKRN